VDVPKLPSYKLPEVSRAAFGLINDGGSVHGQIREYERKLNKIDDLGGRKGVNISEYIMASRKQTMPL
jgi:hypothetical protein